MYEILVKLYGKEVAHDILNKKETEALLKDKDGYGQNIQDFYNKKGLFGSKTKKIKPNILTAGKELEEKDDKEKI